MEERQPRPSRGCSRRLFMLTGFSSTEKNNIIRMIQSLGGKYQDIVGFVPECTHVISSKPVRSEKYLCGCASGKWVLTPGYISQSFKAMRWLDEESYEWSPLYGNGYPLKIVAAPRRWRLHIKRERKAAYNDWAVYLRVEDKHMRQQVYRRLIEAGGGRIVNPLSSTNKTALDSVPTHVIVDPCYATEVKEFAAAGIPCLKPEYLAEFLFEVKPSMGPYNSCPAVSLPDTGEELSTSPTSCPTARLRQRIVIETPQKVEAALAPQSQVLSNGSDSPCSYVMGSWQPGTPSCSTRAPSPSSCSSRTPSPSSCGTSKRKLQTVREIEEAVEARKRRKMEHQEPCVPPWVRSAYKTYKSKDQQPSVSFSAGQLSMVESSIEEGEWFAALVTFQSYLSPMYHPPPMLLHQIMHQMLKTTDSILANACLKCLQSSLCLHSPSLNPEMTQVYLDSLLDGPRDVTALHRYLASTEHWDFLNCVIKLALEQSCDLISQNELLDSSAILLLEFLVYLIEEDFIAWKSRKERNLAVSKHGCMIARIIWPGSRNRLTNVRTSPFKQLVKNCTKVLAKGPHDISIKQFRCLKHVMSLLGMAATYCTHIIGTDLNLANNTLIDFSTTVSTSIMDAGIHDNPRMLSLFLSNLKPQWLKVMVVQNIINQKYQSILDKTKADQLRSMSLNLQKIVDYYFWMVPPFKAPIRPPTRQVKIEQTASKKLLKPLGDSNIKNCERMKKEDLKNKKMTLLVNKRNLRGETPLQVACIKNQLDKVKQLLAIPGINVNAEDNAGWTPLHEAANHGHWACLQELVQFSHKADGLSGAVDKPVDLLAAPAECGTTALHDAVLNNHIECAKLLVKAGGKSVIQVKNSLGFTPLHMAQTNEMKAVLNGADHNKENHGAGVCKVSSSSSLVENLDDSFLEVSDSQYINLLGPQQSRWEVLSEGQCECLCVLSSGLLSSYVSLRELTDIKHEMTKVKDSLSESSRSLQPLIPNKKESLRSSQASQASQVLSTEGSGSPQSQDSQQPCLPENDAIVTDMEVFVSLHKHVEHFVRHVNRLGGWENGLCSNNKCNAAVKSMKALC